MAFMWGEGQRVLQRPLSSVGSPFCHRLQLAPALVHTQWLSWLGPGREGRMARGQSWRHLWTLPDPQSGIRKGAKQGHLRGLSWFFGCSLSLLYSVDSQQTSASCKGLCFPWYYFSHSKNLCAFSSPYLLGNVQLHRHCSLRRLIHWPPTSFHLLLADVHLAIEIPLEGPQCCSWWSRWSF